MPEWGKGKPKPEQVQFLQGPQPRGFELFAALRIFAELIRGFRTLHFAGPCVTVFGSARFTDDHPYYNSAREAGAQLARAGFTVMTGGGPRIMEAANRGAKEAGGTPLDATLNFFTSNSQMPISIAGSPSTTFMFES